jgi:dephospho-CoA kinase
MNLDPVPCRFTEQTGIKVFACDDLARDCLAVAGTVTKAEKRPDGTTVIHRLNVQSISIASSVVD